MVKYIIHFVKMTKNIIGGTKMKEKTYKEIVSKLIMRAKKEGLVKKYSDCCKEEPYENMALSEEEEKYYIKNNEKEKIKKFKIGDIVFVSKYEYKNGISGKNHSFVIIDDGQAVDINYFGFLLSSNVDKIKYKYNEMLHKNNMNKLYKDSIVKCDDLIEINEREIKFKIGTVTEEDIERFIEKYFEYLERLEK